MSDRMTIADLRAELGDTLEQFGTRIDIKSKGNLSLIERDNRCSLPVALRIEELSAGRIDAADLNEDVRAARAGLVHAGEDGPAPGDASAGKSAGVSRCPVPGHADPQSAGAAA
jgi:hypothetical protein